MCPPSLLPPYIRLHHWVGCPAEIGVSYSVHDLSPDIPVGKKSSDLSSNCSQDGGYCAHPRNTVEEFIDRMDHNQVVEPRTWIQHDSK